MKQILIITDDVASYGLYRSLLDDGAIDISHRSSVSEAMTFTRSNYNIVLIIVNFDVPKFGKKQLSSIRKLKNRCKIINLVSHISERVLDECMKLNIYVIRKPLDHESFKELVKDHIESVNIKQHDNQMLNIMEDITNEE